MKNSEPIEEKRLAAALSALGVPDGEQPELPDAAILWRKARLLEALETRRLAVRPVRVAHSIALALASGALLALGGSKGVSLLGWIEKSGAGLTLPLTLSLFVLGAGLFLATGAAAGRNLSRRTGE
ncbi:MAG TPA: hypothetical protein VF958_13410 [Thermoanaerobaculia bacterium]